MSRGHTNQEENGRLWSFCPLKNGRFCDFFVVEKLTLGNQRYLDKQKNAFECPWLVLSDDVWPGGEQSMEMAEIWSAPLRVCHRISFPRQPIENLNTPLCSCRCPRPDKSNRTEIGCSVAEPQAKNKKIQGPEKYPNCGKLGKLPNNLWSAQNWHHCIQLDSLYPTMPLKRRFYGRFGHVPPRNFRHVRIWNIAIFEGDCRSEN